ncbi:MAG: hypothetical protein ACTSQS_00685 [Promethearchaeota archaeon]
MTLIEKIDKIKKKLNLKEGILKELGKLEEKYGIETKVFLEKWKSNTIPEPEDFEILEEFLKWEGLAETLIKVEKELKEIEQRIGKF